MVWGRYLDLRNAWPARETEEPDSGFNPYPLLYLAAASAASAAFGADKDARIVKQGHIPGASSLVVIAEGDFEPRSAGSYSVRVYGGTDARFPFDAFVAGTVRPRDGTIERLAFSDVDADGSPDVVVIVRSTGTGGYRSADAFKVERNQLKLLKSVSNLPKSADPIRALRVEPGDRKPRH